jgi:hypothetical protein
MQCSTPSTTIGGAIGNGGTVRVFRHKFTLDDAIEFRACSLEAIRRVTNGIPLRCPLFLPVHTVNCVKTLKVGLYQHYNKNLAVWVRGRTRRAWRPCSKELFLCGECMVLIVNASFALLDDEKSEEFFTFFLVESRFAGLKSACVRFNSMPLGCPPLPLLHFLLLV